MNDCSGMATMYVWESGQHFDLDSALYAIGGRVPPTMQELRVHTSYKPFYATRDFLVYHHAQGFFTTPLIKARLRNFGLQLPNHEIVFTPRLASPEEGVDLDKIMAFGAFISVTQQVRVLAVNGADIEGRPLYASPDITQKLATIPTE